MQTGEHPALDRPERLVELRGELRLREAAVVGELDRLALLGREPAKRVADDLGPRAGNDLLVRSRAGGLGQGVDRDCSTALFASHEVDRATVHEGQQPRARLGALRPVGAGGAPDLEERLLDGVLGQGRVLEDLVCEPVCDLAEPVVELVESVLVSPGNRLDESFVGALRGLPAHREPLSRVSPNQRGQCRRERARCGSGHVRSLPP